MPRMTIRALIGLAWLCLVAACSGGGSAKVVDARTPDDATAVEGGASQDAAAIDRRDGAAIGGDPSRGESGFVASEAGANGDVVVTTIDVGPGDTLATVTDEAGRASEADVSDTANAAADRPNLDLVDARKIADTAAPPDQPSTTPDLAGPMDTAVAWLDSGTEAGTEAPVIFSSSYYVSPAGNDTTGDGSVARPWKTISAAALRIDYSLGVPTLTIAAGTYDEKVVLHDSIALKGAGSTKVTVKNSNASDTDYVVTADGSSPTVPGAVTVTLTGLYIHGLAAKNRGIRAVLAAIKLDDVNVYQPSAYAISIGPNITGFEIDHTTVGFEGMLYSDVGIDVGNGSSGTIRHFTGGDHIDHIINIGLGCTVDISDSQLMGSPIWYADGIRIQGASNVTIRNTTIVRPPGADPASAGPTHNPPYAGIEVAASGNGNSRVTIDGCTTRGFDVGIGVNLMFNQLLVQNNTLSGNTSAAVRTVWAGSLPLQYPVVDLGGGALGSVGNNDFGNGSEYAVDLGGPYDVDAKNNLWSGTAIESRLHDQLDDPLLGRVQY